MRVTKKQIVLVGIAVVLLLMFTCYAQQARVAEANERIRVEQLKQAALTERGKELERQIVERDAALRIVDRQRQADSARADAEARYARDIGRQVRALSATVLAIQRNGHIDTLYVDSAITRRFAADSAALGACEISRTSCEQALAAAKLSMVPRDSLLVVHDSAQASIEREIAAWKLKSQCYLVKFAGVKCPSRGVMFVGGMVVGGVVSHLLFKDTKIEVVRGADGVAGPVGPQGDPGPVGPAGPQGPSGPSYCESFPNDPICR